MLDVRVCSSCLSKRSDGYSRVSEKIWQSCVDYLQDQNRGVIVEQDDVIHIFTDNSAKKLLLSNEDGFNVDDALLKEVIRAGFTSYRILQTTD